MGILVRNPAVAGSFYDRDPDILRKDIEGFLERAEVHDIKGKIRCLILPHAGYFYSGIVSAYGYKLIQGMENITAVIVGPSHTVFFKGVSVYPGGCWRTPLGDVEVDKEIADKILDSSEVFIGEPGYHRYEHSIEVHLPFLQVVTKNLKVVPLLFGEQSLPITKTAALKLTETLSKTEDIILIISSDLYHGYSFEDCKTIDNQTIEYILEFNPDIFGELVKNREIHACGDHPILFSMYALHKIANIRTKLLYYANSADITGEKTGYVVGYASICVWEEGN